MSDRSEADFPLESIDWLSWPTPPDGLRQEVLVATTAIVRRRVWRRRWRLAAGWGVAYAAGLATAWFAWRHEPARPAQRSEPSIRQIAANEATAKAPAEDLDALSPEDLRRRVAGAPRSEQIRLLRMAGDRYLFGSADVESALDCYRQVIELMPHRALAQRDADDSWLLAELKSSAVGVDSRMVAQ